MKGSSVVARAIRDFEGDPTVKRCLQALFSFELDSGESRSQYKRDYTNEIEKLAPEWKGGIGED